MELSTLLLSRIQFALTVAFHYLFPPLTIGLGVIMVFTEWKYLRTRDRQYEMLAKFWTKIFAVNFAMGVATGIVMEFQFGTNWSVYSRYVGDVFGSALAAEGIFAFFLESGFLAVLVFGWDRVSPRTHFISTVLVSLGSIFSAVWIVVANSWQQTPAGFHVVMRHGMQRAEITDFWAVVFNPSSMVRLTHTLIGAFILGAFVVMSITAFYILRERHVELAKKSFLIALPLATVMSLAQLAVGHYHAVEVAEYQPAKLAAFEGHFETGTGGAPLHLIGWPDTGSRTVKYAVAVPGMLSWLVHFGGSRPVTGLDKFAKKDWPPVAMSFVSYHVMVALGMYFIGLTLLATFLAWRGKLFQTRWLMWVFVLSVIGPYLSNQMGWAAAEIGRQPWIVYGLLRTEDAFSPSVPAGQVGISIAIFSVIYIMLLAVWVFVMNDKIQHGPEDTVYEDAPDGGDLAGIRATMQDKAGESLTATDESREEKH